MPQDYDPTLRNAKEAVRRLKARIAEAEEDEKKIERDWMDVCNKFAGSGVPYPAGPIGRCRGEAFAYRKAVEEFVDLFGLQVEE